MFVDSFYFFALLNPRDPAHAWAAEIADEFDGQFITTVSVLTEVADGLAQHTLRHLFAELCDEIAANRFIHIVPLADDLWHAACHLYRERPDKDWSLTDCISFVVMHRESLTEALTGDHHFEQAGFVPLLK
ncbi:MAG: PIN domain-containing protein [Planctomycetaceae bacterium]|nr:PIN domain-containing protein [Planctomycetaceae bacterium]